MFGLGTIVNTAAVIAGGLFGRLFGKLFKPDQQDSITKVCGISVLFLGIAGAMEGMLTVSDSAVSAGKSMLVVLCLALGTILGELIKIENWFEKFGEWLKKKTGNSKDESFVNAFVSASLTVCIGAMAVVGSIQDGVEGDPSTLCVKALLDFIIIAIMSTSLGKGAVFSALPIFVLEGLMTVLAKLIAPLLTNLAISYLSMIGSIMIFCVGLNLVWEKKIRVANMLPALVFAVAAAYLPNWF